MLRYNKELEYILGYYKNEERRRKYLKDKVVKNMGSNLNLMKKIQEINANKIQSEIEKKSQIREYKNRENKIKLCNEM